ncbi:MAG: N-acetylmuramoyl-L-alanine amidase [Myxococcota bacterium]|nr:N-acetylmuramoyl-L-alanine amidase [Myxococcota bacterium]
MLLLALVGSLPGGPASALPGPPGPPPAAPRAPARALPAAPPLVVLDPGHGGSNEGARTGGGVLEKELTGQITARVRRLLEEQTGVRVALTREQDTYLGLRERAELANRLGAALLLSIHGNSAPHDRARGHETFFLSPAGAARLASPEPDPTLAAAVPSGASEAAAVAAITTELRTTATQRQSERLALLVQQELNRRLVGPSRGVRQATFDVLLHATVPAAVVEVGFLNHPIEGPLLATPAYQERIAAALAAAICRFLEVDRLPAARAGRPGAS